MFFSESKLLVPVFLSRFILAVFCLQDEELHEQSSDVRSQLKFFEHLERLEKQRKDEQEREILLKAAKVSQIRATCGNQGHVHIYTCVHYAGCWGANGQPSGTESKV